MLFPNWYYLAGDYARSVPVLQNETIVAPLYEVMFDTAVLLDKPTFMLAGTHNNNGAVWTDTCSDTIYSAPKDFVTNTDRRPIVVAPKTLPTLLETDINPIGLNMVHIHGIMLQTLRTIFPVPVRLISSRYLTRCLERRARR